MDKATKEIWLNTFKISKSYYRKVFIAGRHLKLLHFSNCILEDTNITLPKTLDLKMEQLKYSGCHCTENYGDEFLYGSGEKADIPFVDIFELIKNSSLKNTLSFVELPEAANSEEAVRSMVKEYDFKHIMFEGSYRNWSMFMFYKIDFKKEKTIKYKVKKSIDKGCIIQ